MDLPLHTELLLRALEVCDTYAAYHSRNVGTLVYELALTVGMPRDQAERVRHAGLLHDVGKIGIASSILHKPAPLSPEEYADLQRHPLIGTYILQSIPDYHELLPLIRHAQEAWDGTGYPDGLRGMAIPLESRLIALADAFDALTTDRPYRRALSVEETLAVLTAGAGVKWDPHIVPIFQEMLRRSHDDD